MLCLNFNASLNFGWKYVLKCTFYGKYTLCIVLYLCFLSKWYNVTFVTQEIDNLGIYCK